MCSERHCVMRVSLTEPQNCLNTDFHFVSISWHSNPSVFFRFLLHFSSITCKMWPTRYWKIHTLTTKLQPSSSAAHTYTLGNESCDATFYGNNGKYGTAISFVCECVLVYVMLYYDAKRSMCMNPHLCHCGKKATLRKNVPYKLQSHLIWK